MLFLHASKTFYVFLNNECVCVFLCDEHVHVSAGSLEARSVGLHGAGVTDSHEPTDLRTGFLCKSNKCS